MNITCSILCYRIYLSGQDIKITPKVIYAVSTSTSCKFCQHHSCTSTFYNICVANKFVVPLKGGVQRVDALVMDLPSSNAIEIKNFVRIRLRRLSENCGGKVMTINGHWALIRFPNFTAALRYVQ